MSVGNDELRVLLIEGDRGDARYLKELFRETTTFADPRAESLSIHGGFNDQGDGSAEILHERTLEAGMAALGDGVDIIVLDLHLPDSQGIETLSTLLACTDAPVVVVTGLENRDIGLRAIREGADDYLVKGEINSDLLIRSVYHAIERRDHERELRQYETLVERSADVNAILDTDGTIRYVTPSVTRVLGYSPDELRGSSAFDLLHPEDRDRVEERLSALVDRTHLPPIEFRIEDNDGDWVILESRGRNLLDDPLVEGIVVYTRDVTERVQREQKLEQFAQVVSHDLRNPLGIAQMYIQEMRRSGALSDLDRVEQALDRMDTLVDTLLTLAQEGQSIDEPSEVNVQDIARAAARHVDTTNASIDIAVERTMLADPERLQTLFENLFRNAVEHGGDGVDIRVVAENGHLIVEDTGPGIPSDEREQVFNFGYSTGGGTGTGLAIVQAIVDAHDWAISVGCGDQGGCRFEVSGIYFE